MLVRDLYNLPILAPGIARVGSYTNGKRYMTDYGYVYTFRDPDGQTVRISRKAIYHLYYYSRKYIDLDDIDTLNSYTVSDSFEVGRVDSNGIYLSKGIFNERTPF